MVANLCVGVDVELLGVYPSVVLPRPHYITTVHLDTSVSTAESKGNILIILCVCVCVRVCGCELLQMTIFYGVHFQYQHSHSSQRTYQITAAEFKGCLILLLVQHPFEFQVVMETLAVTSSLRYELQQNRKC